MIGRKVKLKKSYAKWHLDNIDIYYYMGKVDKSFDVDTQIHLMSCMGVSVYGTVMNESPSTDNCWRVEFKVSNLKMSYYVERHHIEFL